ncbi:arginyl-tRNA synthetase, mitochondrial isoform X1 [Rhodnius prolixus]|uniref:arginyl-tRNA synthetase, mitochondrial isoform X1 n=1 Tax=Rhodnius prolixus TaxID=13249 RepID=UPI003D18A588
MLSHVKKHIISKIIELADRPLEVNIKTLRQLLTLGKYGNGEITFCLPKEAEKLLGKEISLSNFNSDSVIAKVHETNSSTPETKLISFAINKNYFIKTIFSFGINNATNREKEHVLVEYSSPNIAKPFHIGHLRSTIVGNFVANCAHKMFGKVTRLNYLGDWGAQVGYVKVGLDDLGVSDKQLNEDPISILYKAYVHAHSQPGNLEKAKQIFSELEDDTCSQEQRDFWERVRQITMQNLKETYLDLGITFDEYFYESDYRKARIKELLIKLENCGIAKKRQLDGLLVLCPSSKVEIPLLREDGSSLYLSRDIAAAFDRLKKYNDCSKMYYVVDKSQEQHLANVAEAIFSLTGRDVIKHVPFGRVTGVSSRKGTTLLLQDILEKATVAMALQQRASDNSRTDDPEVTKILAVTTLMIYILRQARCRDFVFNWDNAMQGKGDTGVKLQYTHCRLCSLEEICGVEAPTVCEPDLLTEPLLLEIILEIARSEEVIQFSMENMESSNLVSYLFKLCNLLSRSLRHIAVKGQPKDIAQQRLLVFLKARQTLAECMSLLGLKPLRQM